MERHFDVVVVGAGPAGEVAAGRIASRSNKRVAIVERDLVGGECSYYACMPSKSLLRPAQALAEARRVPGAAQAAGGELDVQAVLDRRDQVVHNLDDSAQLPWLEDRGVTLVRGDAELTGARRLKVGEDTVTAADAVIVATGSTAVVPPIPGLREASAWTNREITTAKAVPEHLLILGGGVVGVEMAQAWATLGSTVTVIEAGDRVIAQEEPIASALVADGLRQLGVDLRIGAKATNVRRENGSVTVELENGTAASGSHLLVAVGRRPNTGSLGLEQFGLEPGKSIEVDDHLRVTDHPWMYAIGDVNGRALLTHAGKYQARIAVDHILGEAGAVAWADRNHAVPRVVFTEPQVAAVGATLETALGAGAAAVAVDLPTDSSAGASFYGHGAPGQSRFVVDTDREVLLGVTFTGPDIQDFLQAATIAVVAEIPLRRLAHAIAPFPTRSELWLSFLEAYEQQQSVTVHSS